ncbi:hypothetical protein BDP81DRAFT_396786 [Colletotrichum phormii]|uniref:Uncharacterized protein n=1 Tax=Colletotrichum phormii TaxID=359342 RepID=A0AAI9ZLG3_9PEZI|nr:uncharacterized protein BDP81DRAFT_396786 [Colletotrichum phormii]KAK1634084.1 hypothetical protein BDP81DRAFT_396786 [Colletotrichum phormii]
MSIRAAEHALPYPPPTGLEYEARLIERLLCLGHLITDLAHLDNIINAQQPLGIPADLPIYRKKSETVSWEHGSGPSINQSGQTGAPIVAAAGITVTASAGIAFQKTVINHSESKVLDTYTIPNGVMVFIMVTGITIARGAQIVRSERRKMGVQGGLGA